MIKKLFVVLFCFSLSVLLGGCPDIQSSQPSTEGYLVRTNPEYRGHVIGQRIPGGNCYGMYDSLFYLENDYFLFSPGCSYSDAVVTSLLYSDWFENYIYNVTEFVIDSDPFIEVYLCDTKYKNHLRECVINNDFEGLERVK